MSGPFFCIANPAKPLLSTPSSNGVSVACDATAADLKPLDTHSNPCVSFKSDICVNLLNGLTSVITFSLSCFSCDKNCLAAISNNSSSSASTPICGRYDTNLLSSVGYARLMSAVLCANSGVICFLNNSTSFLLAVDCLE